MGTTSEYTFSTTFRAWLAKFRPRALAALDAAGIRSGLLTHGGGPRSVVRFPGLAAAGLDSDFDVAVATNDACVVLDGHPDGTPEHRQLLAVANACGPIPGGGIQLPPSREAFALEAIRSIVTLATGYEFPELC